MNEPYVVKPGEGRALEFYGTRIWVKAAAETTSAFSLIEGVWQPGGFGPMPHIHPNDEGFYVLEGEFDFTIGDDTVRGAAGSFVFVPQGTWHAFRVAGDRPSRLMFLHTPPLDGYFVELAELASQGLQEPDRIAALMGRWGMEAKIP